MSILNRRVFAALLIAAFGALTACGTTTQSSTPAAVQWQTATQAIAEFQQAEQDLTLAPGWQWKANPMRIAGPDGRPQYYQPGAATNDAQLYWFCSWAAQAVHAAPNSADQYTATRQLESVRAKYLYQQGLSAPSRTMFDTVLGGVQRGDFQALHRYLVQNCDGPQ